MTAQEHAIEANRLLALREQMIASVNEVTDSESTVADAVAAYCAEAVRSVEEAAVTSLVLAAAELMGDEPKGGEQ